MWNVTGCCIGAFGCNHLTPQLLYWLHLSSRIHHCDVVLSGICANIEFSLVSFQFFKLLFFNWCYSIVVVGNFVRPMSSVQASNIFIAYSLSNDVCTAKTKQALVPTSGNLFIHDRCLPQIWAVDKKCTQALH